MMQAEDARLLGEFGIMKKMYTQLQHLNRQDCNIPEASPLHRKVVL